MKFLLAFALLLTGCAATKAASVGELGREPSSDSLPWTSFGGIDSLTLERSLVVVRVDPKVTPVELVNPPESGGMSVARIAKARDFAVVINAAMFAADYLTSIGYMRNYSQVNNPNISAKLRGFLMFNPKNPTLPAAKIGGKPEIGAYNTVFQTHRVWDPQGGILWKKGASVYHHVGLVGVDARSRIYFFYHPPLIDVHEFVEKILALNLELTGILYLDGGNHGALHLAPELGQGANTFMPLPNVLGVKAR